MAAVPPRPESLRTCFHIVEECKALVRGMADAKADETAISSLAKEISRSDVDDASGDSTGSLANCHALGEPVHAWRRSLSLRIQELRGVLKTVKAAQDAISGPGVNPARGNLSRQALDLLLARLSHFVTEYNQPKASADAVAAFAEHMRRQQDERALQTGAKSRLESIVSELKREVAALGFPDPSVDGKDGSQATVSIGTQGDSDCTAIDVDLAADAPCAVRSVTVTRIVSDKDLAVPDAGAHLLALLRQQLPLPPSTAEASSSAALIQSAPAGAAAGEEEAGASSLLTVPAARPEPAPVTRASRALGAVLARLAAEESRRQRGPALGLPAVSASVAETMAQAAAAAGPWAAFRYRTDGPSLVFASASAAAAAGPRQWAGAPSQALLTPLVGDHSLLCAGCYVPAQLPAAQATALGPALVQAVSDALAADAGGPAPIVLVDPPVAVAAADARALLMLLAASGPGSAAADAAAAAADLSLLGPAALSAGAAVGVEGSPSHTSSRCGRVGAGAAGAAELAGDHSFWRLLASERYRVDCLASPGSIPAPDAPAVGPLPAIPFAQSPVPAAPASLQRFARSWPVVWRARHPLLSASFTVLPSPAARALLAQRGLLVSHLPTAPALLPGGGGAKAATSATAASGAAETPAAVAALAGTWASSAGAFDAAARWLRRRVLTNRALLSVLGDAALSAPPARIGAAYRAARVSALAARQAAALVAVTARGASAGASSSAMSDDGDSAAAAGTAELRRAPASSAASPFGAASAAAPGRRLLRALDPELAEDFDGAEGEDEAEAEGGDGAGGGREDSLAAGGSSAQVCDEDALLLHLDLPDPCTLVVSTMVPAAPRPNGKDGGATWLLAIKAAADAPLVFRVALQTGEPAEALLAPAADAAFSADGGEPRLRGLADEVQRLFTATGSLAACVLHLARGIA